MLWSRDMRAALAFIITAGIAGAVLLQKERESTPSSRTPTAPRTLSAAQAEQPVAQHWPKRALDRAADVKRQVTEQREDDETR